MAKFSWEEDQTMQVVKVEDQGDRVLLYKNEHYYIIAPQDCTVKIGDIIVYEPFGVNFGWFVSLKE